ncbi:MAG: FliM/FliN family flagellar motor switch protein [Pseudomonadota bacterium]
MSQAAAYSVIHRKAKVARDEFDAREMSPAKALRLSMAKTAETLFHLALVVRTVEQVTVSLPQMEASLGEGGLLIVLDEPDGLRGAVKLDHAFVTALIEVQLIGQLRDKTPEPRPFTHTDAAITQPLINEVLGLFHQILAEDSIESGVDSLRFGDMVEDARTLVLGLEAPDFELYRLNVDLGPGKRTGQMELYLPHRPIIPNDTEAGDMGGLAQKLEKAAMNAPVTLDAALTRMRLPLSDVLKWTPGTTLVIDHGVLGDGVLLGAKEHEVARFKLGQFEGFRAVQLVSEAVPDDGSEGQSHAAQIADEVGQAAQLAPPSDIESAGLDLGDTDSFAMSDHGSLELDDETTGSPEDADWPALDGLDSVTDDLDSMLLDVPDSDPSAEPMLDDAGDDSGDDGDFAPLPMMMVADIDLEE